MLIHFNNGQRTTDDGHPPDSKLVVIVAGEASADLHGSNLVMAMKRLVPTSSSGASAGRKWRKPESISFSPLLKWLWSV